MAIASLKLDECVCGRFYAIFQAESYHLAEFIGAVCAGAMDIFICGEQAHCSVCGREIITPPAEILDIERSEFGRWLIDNRLSE